MPMRRISMYVALFLITVMFTLTACSSSNSPAAAPITVTVSDQLSHAYPGVTVVLGDRDGAMKEYGTTDSNGQITFATPPANATVTAAASCLSSGATTTTYSLDVRYDVNRLASLQLDGCQTSLVSSTGSTALGTITLNITNATSGITQYAVAANRSFFAAFGGLITQQTITIEPYDLQIDGKLSLFVVGSDNNGTLLSYGYVLDQTFTDGMTVNVAVNEPVSYLQYRISNLPSTANYLCSGVYQARTGKGGLWLDDCQNLASGLTSTIVSVPYMPGFGDQFLHNVTLSSYQYLNSTTSVYSYQSLGTGPYAPVLANQSFDLNQLLTVPTATVSGADTPTPTISWSGVDPDAAQISVFASFRLSASTYYLMVSDPGAGRTSYTFPELPDSLAEFRPVAVTAFYVDTFSSDTAFYRSSGSSYYHY